MSKKHPVVVVTGSSGAGTTTVKRAFEHIFTREKLSAAVIEGDSMHSLGRVEFKEAMKKAEAAGIHSFSHFGPEANDFEGLANMFKVYGETGTGKKRYYIHSDEEAAQLNARLGTNLKPGEFTPWEDMPANTDILFYEGLHGLVKTDQVNMPQHVDLGVGVVLSEQGFTSSDIRAAIERILADPAFRQNSLKMSTALGAAGGYQRAADVIQTFVQRGRFAQPKADGGLALALPE